ncbi:sensor domain-containing diguanylate cyclase [Consotaella aegiceratis]|uniref:sensor domain-containing diguanylate cyclase n=1 Tax=Consotaella aegiceratis TaxID=3097961 RepID=UPI002F3F56A4
MSLIPLAPLLRTLVLVMCAAIIGLQIWDGINERDRIFQETETDLGNLSRSLMQQAEDSFEMADLATSAVVQSLDAASGTMAVSSDDLKALTERSPRLQALAIFDADGRWVVNSFDSQSPNANNGDRDYFLYHKTHADKTLHIGNPVKSRMQGQWIIPATRRFDKPDGSFGGIVAATIDVDYFTDFFSEFEVGKAGSIDLFNADGTLLSRWPPLEGTIGTKLPFRSTSGDVPTTDTAGTSQITSPYDGIERIIAYQYGARYPLAVVCTMAEDEIMAIWRNRFALQIAVVILLAAVLGHIGFKLAGQVARRQLAEVQLAEMAATDGLTNLNNRREFDRRLALEWARAGREQKALSLILLDVDRFKVYNDSFGHLAGDDCLRAIGATLGGFVRRPGDVAARFGGEEFALVLYDAEPAAVQSVAERLRVAVEELGLPHQRNRPAGVVTVSLGCATLNPSPFSILTESVLVALADEALYDAKRQGRNRTAVMRSVLQSDNRADLRLLKTA